MAIKQCAVSTDLSPEQLLGRYEGLLTLATQINELARRGNWMELIEKESQYVIESEQLSRLDTSAMAPHHYERKADLLEHIFSLDLETRSLLIARREQLRRQIGDLDLNGRGDAADTGPVIDTP